LDGFALAELMRNVERREIPIIFVTAGLHDQDRVFKGYESGGGGLPGQAARPRILASKVNVFLQLYRQRQLLMVANAQLLEADISARMNSWRCSRTSCATPWRPSKNSPLHPQPVPLPWGAGPPRPGGDRAPGHATVEPGRRPARRDPYHAQTRFACRSSVLTSTSSSIVRWKTTAASSSATRCGCHASWRRPR